MGATVFKLESSEGDPARHMAPVLEGASAFYHALNAGKKSVRLNLKEQQNIFREMVTKADVLIDSFRPGVMGKLGLESGALLKLNPKLVHCSITGYGTTQSPVGLVGHDVNFLARAGVMSLMPCSEGVPAIPGVQIGDVFGGAQGAVSAVLAALLERTRTGKGRHIEISMAREVHKLARLSYLAQGMGFLPLEGGNSFLSGGLPCYRAYPTADGKFMAVGALEPKFFKTICEIVGRPELTDKAFASGEERDSAVSQLEESFRSRTQDEWVKAFEGVSTCCEPVVTVAEAIEDPLVNAPAIGKYRFWTNSMVPPPEGLESAELAEELGADTEMAYAFFDISSGSSPKS